MHVVHTEIRNVEAGSGQVVPVPLQYIEKTVDRTVELQAVDFRGDVLQGNDLDLQFQVLIGGIRKSPPQSDLLPAVVIHHHILDFDAVQAAVEDHLVHTVS